MHPLLVTGITSIAGQLLDTWNRAIARKAPIAGDAQFDAVLSKATAAAAVGKTGGAASGEARIAELRRSLMEMPEVRTALDSADPAHPPIITVDAAGQIHVESPDGRSSALVLSAETQALVRELSSLLSLASGVAPGRAHRLA